MGQHREEYGDRITGKCRGPYNTVISGTFFVLFDHCLELHVIKFGSNSPACLYCMYCVLSLCKVYNIILKIPWHSLIVRYIEIKIYASANIEITCNAIRRYSDKLHTTCGAQYRGSTALLECMQWTLFGAGMRGNAGHACVMAC